MPRRLVYSPEARDDLETIRRWLTQSGAGASARHRLTRIRDEIRRLQQTPCQWPALDYPGVREVPCAGGYRALYEVVPDTGRNNDAGDVRVLRVFGPGQDRGVFLAPPR